MGDQGSPYALFDYVPLGVCVLSRDLSVRFWNTCLEQWTHIPRAQVLGTDLAERYPHLLQPRYFDRLETVWDGGPPAIFSSQLHRHMIHAPLPDGRPRIQHTIVIPIPAPDGFDALVSIQDVTDMTQRLEDLHESQRQTLREARERQRAEEARRKLAAKIQHAEKLESLEALAGGIAHDFNNLLVGILGNANLSLAEESPASPRRQYLEAIIGSAQRAAELSNQMLAFSGKGKFMTRILNLSELVLDVVQFMEPSIPKPTQLDFDLPEEALNVEADAAQLRQVISNLLANAKDALGERGGTIRLAAGFQDWAGGHVAGFFPMQDLPSGSYVYLEVADDGPGMVPEMVEKIFDPFFTTKFTGRGLGLAAVLGIVRGHGGAIRVESAPGQGTTMRVFLPASGFPAAEPDRLEECQIELEGTETVLVIDDEEAVRQVAQKSLELAGFQVLTATDGRRGIELFRSHREEIVVVLLDLTMPRLSGQETYEELRNIESDVRIVLSSGYSEEEARDRFAGQPLAGFLQKPYQPAELTAKMKAALGQR